MQKNTVVPDPVPFVISCTASCTCDTQGAAGKCGGSGDVTSHLERRGGPIRATHVLVVTRPTNCVFRGKGRGEGRGRREGSRKEETMEKRKEEKMERRVDGGMKDKRNKGRKKERRKEGRNKDSIEEGRKDGKMNGR